jgi:hypothetical protein
MRNLISVVAIVNLTKGEGRIEYVNPVPQGEVSPPVAGSPVVLTVKGEDGKLLYEANVDVKPLSDTREGQDKLAMVNAIVPASSGAAAIEMSIGGESADVFRASKATPTIFSLGRAETEGDQIALSWKTSAGPKDRHTYSVQASADNGRTWQTLAVGVPTPEIAIDRNQFRNPDQILIRIIATNGFQSSELVEQLPNYPVKPR